MKLLIVEGNPARVRQAREAQGGVAYYRRFVQLLSDWGYNDTTVAFPADAQALPNSAQLAAFDGILLTGSSLNVYDTCAEVTRQLDFAEHCFASGVPIYGSCWGLQVAVTVAGGQIGKNQQGREFGIAQNITLTTAGRQSPFYADKPAVFDAYCIHEDDTHRLPDNTVVLAENAHSSVQALQLHYRRADFFGVQYHPEFIYDDAVFLANFMQARLTEEGIFSTQRSKTAYLAQMAGHNNLNDRDFHTREIANWLRSLS